VPRAQGRSEIRGVKWGRRGFDYLDHALELFLNLLLVDEAIYPILDMIP